MNPIPHVQDVHAEVIDAVPRSSRIAGVAHRPMCDVLPHPIPFGTYAEERTSMRNLDKEIPMTIADVNRILQVPG